MRVIETNVYKFEELTDEAKEKAIESLWDINVTFNWWDFTYYDLENVGIKVKSFDIDRGSYCNIDLYDSMIYVMNKILENHGEECDTYKLATEYHNERDEIVSKYSQYRTTGKGSDEIVDESKEHLFDEEEEELNEEYKTQLSEVVLEMLRNQYDYLTGEEAIKETIISNEYEFTEEGGLF